MQAVNSHLFRIMSKVSEDAVMVFDNSLRILHWNHVMARRTGRPESETLGMPLLSIFTEWENGPEWELIKLIRQGHFPDSLQTYLYHRHLQERILQQVSMYPTLDADHAFAGVLCIFRDPNFQDKRLERRIALEDIIANISKRFVDISSDKINTAVEEALEIIGRFEHIDRCYVFLRHGEQLIVSNTHEWCASGIAPQKEGLQELPLEAFPWTSARLLQLEVVHVPNVSAMPDEAAMERELYLGQQIKSVILVPISFKKEMIGFLGFDTVRQHKIWPEDSQQLLRVVGEIFFSAIQRMQTEDALALINQRYRDIGEISSDFIIQFALTSSDEVQLAWVAGAFEEITGFERVSSLTTNDMLRLVPAEDIPATLASFQAVIGGANQTLEFRLRTRHKGVIWLRCTARPVWGDGATLPKGILASFTNISDRKSIEEQLRNQERLLSAALEAMPVAVGLRDDHLRWLYANSLMLNTLGVSDNSYLGKTNDELSQLIPELTQHLSYHNESDYEILRSGNSISAEQRSIRMGTDTRYFQNIRGPILLANGKSGVLETVIDITARKKDEHRLQNLTAELMRSNEELQQFAYITSHNLRAPVSNLIGLLDLYDLEDPDNPLNSEILVKISTSVQQLQTTLTDLMNIITVKEHRGQFQELLYLEEICRDILMSIEDQIRLYQAEIHTDFSRAPVIYFPKPFLQSILLNLLTNSLKYHRPGRLPQIWVDSYEIDTYICITIRDNGVGIDLAKHQHRLFGMFQRLQDHIEGKGLGLYIVKSQIESMGGRIEVSSTPGEGTTFQLYFQKSDLSILI
ncbi:MAG: ATP-binding protein [Bacteroidia bacterium]|nr:ATP-binding protein [Bacteroidia bacterium]